MAIFKCSCNFVNGGYPTISVYIESKNQSIATARFLNELPFSTGKKVTVEQVSDWPEWMKRLEGSRRG